MLKQPKQPHKPKSKDFGHFLMPIPYTHSITLRELPFCKACGEYYLISQHKCSNPTCPKPLDEKIFATLFGKKPTK